MINLLPTYAPDSHEYFMVQALAQARQAWGVSKPNPAVGCVLRKDNRLIASGYTQEVGYAHAEVMALTMAGAQAQGATAYVTLEPCAHTGRTPPCTQALIKAGISRVVFGCQDPNALVQGKGLAQLRQAGIEVVGPVLPAACAAINPGYMHRMATGQALITSKLACSLDGRTAMASGESQWITGAEARAWGHVLRAQSCALITGVGSVLADDPALNARPAELRLAGWQQAQIERVKQPLRIILDTHLRTPIHAKVFSVPSDIIIMTAVTDEARHQAYTAQGVQVLVLDMTGNTQGQHPPTLDLNQVIAYLTQAGCQHIMLEAGPGLNSAFLRQGLLKRLDVFMAPKLLGAEGKPLIDWSIKALKDARLGQFNECVRVGEDLFLQLALHNHNLTAL